ncbi:50S ribosomal protein L30 [Borrelia sp. CA_690]|uniref:Large ribosomal subunit protein uL30 n=1 Tax=Borrelia maritima TaxID=2761123 RepID=A0A5J6WC19_9SPIR|nr:MULTISPECIES: 50S ribosomal protein L30 [Borrelia]QFI14611.1 50S ribosomal protein L30 [Borrelia maritima]WKC84468.1 50S ribosomal protein L30 [Borrelia sp. CA_690]
MIKRKLRLQLKKARFNASRARSKNKCFIRRMEKNKEIISKSNINVQVCLVRSLIGKLDKKVKVLKALGLNKMGDKKVHFLNESIKGMLNKSINMILLSEVSNV